ncbi:hypothetical protein BRC89_04175 [Halobacteriales archaeon QS_4_70_19]|nr:MAG: hypothetical protein BRC89_04175 [Halobacteriales archaeon QS_4_70_19]
MSPDRQALAVAGTVALLLGALGGGALYLIDESEPDPLPPYEPTANVPSDVDYVGTLNATEYRSDPAVANGTRASLGFQSRVEFYSGPPFLRSLVLSPPANANLDPTNASHVTYFGRSDSPYGARLVAANWTAEAAVDALQERRDTTFTRDDRDGYTVYRSESGPAVAVLDDGTRGGPVPRPGPHLLAIGNASAVADAVTVAADRRDPEAEADTLDGELRRRYSDTDEGYVRFAYRFRPETVPDYAFVGSAVRTVEWVGSSYTRNRTGAAGTPGGTVPTAAATTPTDDGAPDAAESPDIRVRIRITVEDADSADDVRNVLEAGRSFYLFQSSNARLKAELRETSFDVMGRTVVADYESSPGGLRVLVRGLFQNQPEAESLAPPGREEVKRRGHGGPGAGGPVTASGSAVRDPV